jgi:hypothetical protein
VNSFPDCEFSWFLSVTLRIRESGWLIRYSHRLQAGLPGFDSWQGQGFSLLHTGSIAQKGQQKLQRGNEYRSQDLKPEDLFVGYETMVTALFSFLNYVM